MRGSGTEGCETRSLVICLRSLPLGLTSALPVQAAAGCVEPGSGSGEGEVCVLVVLKGAINHPRKKTPPEPKQHPQQLLEPSSIIPTAPRQRFPCIKIAKKGSRRKALPNPEVLGDHSETRSSA